MKNQRGITLVALVITIIILIILAGITLSLVLGENGLINKAKEGGERYKTEAEKEQTMLGEYSDFILNGKISETDSEAKFSSKISGTNINKAIEVGTDIKIEDFYSNASSATIKYNNNSISNLNELTIGEYAFSYDKENNIIEVTKKIDGELVIDLSGQGHDLQLNNGATIEQDESGNYYMKFDGIDDYGQIDELEASIDWENGFTVEFEAEWNALNHWSRIYDFGNGSDTNNLFLANDSTSSNMAIGLYGDHIERRFVISNVDLNEKNKYVINVAKQEGGYQITTTKNNGEPSVTSSNGIANNITRVSNYVAKSNWSTDSYFKGKIYSLKITLADNTPVLEFDINKQVNRTQRKEINIISNDYAGNIADLSDHYRKLYLNSGASIVKDANDKYYINFDGTDDYGQIDTIGQSVDWENGFTVEVEAEWDSFNLWSRIFDFANGPSNNNLFLSNKDTLTTLLLGLYGVNVEGKNEVSTIVQGETNKYVIQVEKQGTSYQITTTMNNGEPGVISSNGVINNVKRVSNFLGQSNWSSDGHFNGKIYSLKITQADGTVIVWYDVNKWLEMSE